jgi:hypothetical protein
MGLFWDLLQQGDIDDQGKKLGTLEDRVAQLESELKDTRRVLRELISRLERNLRVDLDSDGRLG